jgi:hypothetical protein
MPRAPESDRSGASRHRASSRSVSQNVRDSSAAFTRLATRAYRFGFEPRNRKVSAHSFARRRRVGPLTLAARRGSAVGPSKGSCCSRRRRCGGLCASRQNSLRIRVFPQKAAYSSMKLISVGGSNRSLFLGICEVNGRGDWIRTSGLSVPNRALYQAEPRPDRTASVARKATLNAAHREP